MKIFKPKVKFKVEKSEENEHDCRGLYIGKYKATFLDVTASVVETPTPFMKGERLTVYLDTRERTDKDLRKKLKEKYHDSFQVKSRQEWTNTIVGRVI